jgi:hypothetical protein
MGEGNANGFVGYEYKDVSSNAIWKTLLWTTTRTLDGTGGTAPRSTSSAQYTLNLARQRIRTRTNSTSCSDNLTPP